MISFTFDVDRAVQDIDDRIRRQVPFALALTLNRVAEERQRALQQHILAQLTIRNAGARANFPKVIRFARADRADKSARRFVATLRILGGDLKATAPVLQRLSSIVIRQDEKQPGTSTQMYRAPVGRRGSRLVQGGFAIPSEGLRTANKGMPRSLYPVNLGLTPKRAIAGGETYASNYRAKVNKRTRQFRKGTKFYFAAEHKGVFVREQLSSTHTIHGVTPTGGRWTRQVQDSQYDQIWFFRPRVAASRRLDIDRTFRTGLDQQLAVNFAGFLRYATRTDSSKA